MTRAIIASVIACAALAVTPAPAAAAGGPHVAPANSRPHGLSYAEWSARWWQWGMEYPVAGHPFIDSPDFSVSARQSGQVWFLGAPFGTTTRNVSIPNGTAIFFALLNAEESSNEGFPTAADQQAGATFNADHIQGLFCTIDGDAVQNLGNYRFVSPQLSFVAPSPWIFDPAPSGPGTSVGDGYYLFLNPMSTGRHTLHWGGSFHFSPEEVPPSGLDFPLDMTYNITVGR